MKNLSMMIFALFCVACSSSPSNLNVLEEAFPEEEFEDLHPELIYLAWPYLYEPRRYGFQVDGDILYYAEREWISENKSLIKKFVLSIPDCAGLSELVLKLKPNINESSAIILGYKPRIKSGIIMVDGLFYSLEYLSGYESVKLIGQGMSEYELTWIKPAEHIRKIAKECNST
jgi:hypothetical protein